MTPLFILVRVWIWVIGEVGDSWSDHGLFELWLGYFALVFVSLMQLLSYMLWIKKCSMTFSLESEHGFYM